MPACPECPTTTAAPTTTPPPGSTCCLQVRYICQKVGGYSTWVLDLATTQCAAAANCAAFFELCTPTEFVYIQPDGCICSNPLPALPVPTCLPSCGDPALTTTAPPPTTTPPATTAPPATTTPPVTTAPDPCTTLGCTGGNEASVSGFGCGGCSPALFLEYTPCNPALPSPAIWVYHGTTPGTCTLSVEVEFIGGVWTVIVGNNNGATMPAGSSTWSGTFAENALTCVGGILTGSVNVPFASSTGVGCGGGTVTVTFS